MFGHSDQTTRFTITPSANGCTGAAINASVVVNPLTYLSDKSGASTNTDLSGRKIKSGGLGFSSNWNSTTTIEQTLAVGNLEVSPDSSFGSSSTLVKNSSLTNQLREIQESYAGKLNVTVLPNPSRSYFTLHIQSGSDKPLQVKTVDAFGRVIESRDGIPASGTLMLGGKYRPGIYFAEMLQGSDRVILKLIKQ